MTEIEHPAEPDTLGFAQEAFEHNPSPKTAGAYIRQLLDYSGDDMIGDDEFLNKLALIAETLQHI